MDTFAPTHEICVEYPLGRRELIAVRLDDGAAYTQLEWDTDSAADWECDADDNWTFQGRAAPAGATVSVREWSRRCGSWFRDESDDLIWVPSDVIARDRSVLDGLTPADEASRG